MLEIFSVTSTIFIIISAGYIAVRVGPFSSGEMQILGKFVINFALPALIVRAVSKQPIDEFANVGYLSAVLLGSLIVFGAGYIWSRKIANESRAASTFSAMGMSCANSGFIGFPILLVTLPNVAATALAMNMIIENLVMIPMVLMMAEYARARDVNRAQISQMITKRLIRNPIVIALALGLALSTFRIELPSAIALSFDMFARASAAVSLVVIGGTLAGFSFKTLKPAVLRIVIGKLILHPFAVGLSFVLLSQIGWGIKDEGLIAAAIIIASAPAMSIYPILAQSLGEGQNASLAMIIMTFVSYFTMNAVLIMVLQ